MPGAVKAAPGITITLERLLQLAERDVEMQRHHAWLRTLRPDPVGAALNLRYRFTLPPAQRAAGRYIDAYWKWLRRERRAAPIVPRGVSPCMAKVLREQCDYEFRVQQRH
jgi:hypothetical protein